MKKCIVSLLLFVLLSPAYATSLSGRLFYTPAQRTQIEAGRNRGTPTPADTAPAAGDTLYNGYVTRSDGSTTLWINGQPRRMQPASGTPGKLKLPAIPALKPGQEFNTQYGRILEPYERPAAVLAVQPAVPAARKTQRNSLPDGDDAPGDSSHEGDSAQPPAASEH
ncbi:hypothetical protein ACFDAU_13590 [Sulfuriferula sp. GW1]|uniref:hypothetical protein n=1 Tax=Sulfuriferula sp. GW1 TaxID=3345111 RepID=UPI0039B0F764